MNSRFGLRDADPRLPRDRWVQASDHPDQPTKPPSSSISADEQQAVRAPIPGDAERVIDGLTYAKLVAYAGDRSFADSLSIRPIVEPKLPGERTLDA